ncbi:hypothetical protein ACHHYP_09224 [Achlya hypogyna]|uniref:Uncharacterized protein n=1 Tax=Achlya hypogyna TaxID=1202772 RepID=A0A1V9YNR1_ACHHY|nr:hypothetical protein ACHHYP_09224 [Achlya hypogyna]
MAGTCLSSDPSEPCAARSWGDCGFEWLHAAPIASFCLVWTLLGGRMLFHSGAAPSLFRRDPAKLHDHIAQGVAIALAQRRYGSLRVQRVQRMLRLSAMWTEWLEFTLAPLNIAFMVTGSPSELYSLLFTLNVANEPLNMGFLAALKAMSIRSPCFGFLTVAVDDELLERVLYPLVFDVCYISMIATFVRVGTCPSGVTHLQLPGGVSCDCVDLFGFFWAGGLVCFALQYCGALHHKMSIEPLATTTDFRFQPSYQFLIVMARTVGPLAAMIVMNIGAHRVAVLVILVCLLFVWTFLLVYSYTTQPCIGSGSGPNNIRVVTFSSAVYTTLSSISVVIVDGSLRSLLLTLTPLPLVWVIAWHANHRRAERFHIPNISILGLLLHPSPAIAKVGAVAALHMNPTNVISRDHKPIIDQLRHLAATASDPSSRVYALRTLWFCVLKSFLDAGTPIVGEMTAPLPRNVWKKDRSNLDRQGRAVTQPSKRVKLVRVTDRTQLSLVAVRRSTVDLLQDLAGKSRILNPFGRRSAVAPVHAPADASFYMLKLGGHVWISEKLTADAVTSELQRMYAEALRALHDSMAIQNRDAMRESAAFLLQWYRTGYVRLSRDNFLQVLSVLSLVGPRKIAIDATNSLYAATLNKIMPEIIWLQHPSYLNAFASALRVGNTVTVGNCADVLVRVVEAAQQQQRPVPLTQKSMKKVEMALDRWRANYRISDALERLYIIVAVVDAETRPSTPPGTATRSKGTLRNKRRRHSIETTSYSSFSTFVRSCRISMVLPVPFAPVGALDPVRARSAFHAHVLRRVAALSSWHDWTYQLRLTDISMYKDMARKMLRPKGALRLYHRPASSTNPDVLAGVERRRMQRRQFVEILGRAYALYLSTMDGTRPRSKRFGFQDTIDAVVDLYSAPQECAIRDYVATALDSSVHAFLEPHLTGAMNDWSLPPVRSEVDS